MQVTKLVAPGPLVELIAALHAGDSPATTQPKLLVRNHSLDLGRIRITHQHCLTQLAFTLLVLGSQHVAQMRMMTLDLASRRLLEALGGAFMCL